jgi:uncharacterized protein (DUF1778 family)
MSAARKTPKSDRLEARIPHVLKQRLERAAALEGTRISEFVTRHLFEATEKVIQTHEMMTLTEEDTKLFVEAVLNPSEPNETLRKAAKRSRETVGE